MAVMAGAVSAQPMKPKRISVLGATGSVGCNTLDLVALHPKLYELEALTAHRNVALLAKQARALRPKLAVIGDASLYGELKAALEGANIEAAAGEQAIVEAAERPADWVMGGIVGSAGLKPTLAAVRRGACVALANKECLVSAGELFLKEVTKSGATLLPVDSEHNAIFQVFDFDHPEAVDKITLTASGGPFRTWPAEEMARATPEQAVAHPNWDMGAKISVDSATMMNKGLELIEAFHLFPVSMDQIDILVHPQSVIHSMVSYVDGSVLAQLGTPDMRTPIAYTLAWPERVASPSQKLDLARIATLSFEAPDPERFPALRIAREALQSGGGAPTIVNAANEVGVSGFLEGRLGFLNITHVIEETLDVLAGGRNSYPESLDDIYALDAMARRTCEEAVARLSHV